MSTEASTLVLGMSPQWFAGGLFALTYILVMTERVNRAIIALLAAGIMIFSFFYTRMRVSSRANRYADHGRLRVDHPYPG